MRKGGAPEPAKPEREDAEGDDICGLCGKPGADKMPHPVHWPGEEAPTTQYIHAECEDAECKRAHAAQSQEERDAFLRTI